MLDFVTIIFNDTMELKLLGLQATSFELVDSNIINNIYIIFNDNVTLFNKFGQYFYDKIIKYYPEYLQKKIKLLSLNDMGLNIDKTSWFTQQTIKIHISKYVETNYYIVLDSKNHFKEKISYNDFFYDNKPILRFNTHNEKMLQFYFNCLNYFNVECPYNDNLSLKIQTTTPFVFIKDICIQLITYIEEKEKMLFYEFIIQTKLYTEFFLYYAFLIYLTKLNLYKYINQSFVITIGPMDPNIHYFNTWEYKKEQMKDNNFKIIALHRRSINFLDKKYKNNLLQFYRNKYIYSNVHEIAESILN